MQHSRSLALLNGQLIANYYLDGIAEEIQVWRSDEYEALIAPSKAMISINVLFADEIQASCVRCDGNHGHPR